MSYLPHVLGAEFELFWASDDKGETWRLSRALQTHLGLAHTTDYRQILEAVHPRDRPRIRTQLEHACKVRDSVDLGFQVYLPAHAVFARCRLVGWPRFVDSRFTGHIGFWRIKLPLPPPLHPPVNTALSAVAVLAKVLEAALEAAF